MKFTKQLLYCVALLLVVVLSQAVSSRAETPPVVVEGTVVEILNTDGYSYVCILSNGQLNWAATRGAAVDVGDEVVIASGSTMVTDFESEALGRTFDTMIFTNAITKR